MIELDFFNATDSLGVVKATVHRTGKLGFSSGAAKLMKLDDIQYLNIGYNKLDETDESLYLLPVQYPNEKSFKVIKSGMYFYVFIKHILREKKVEYIKESVIYDIIEIEVAGATAYKLERRKRK